MNISLLGDDPGMLSTVASISAGATRAMDSIYTNARNAALAAGKSEAEAEAAGKAAVAAYQSSIVTSANARIAQARAEAERRRLLSIIETQSALQTVPQTSNVELVEEHGPSILPLALLASVGAYFMFKG